MSAPVDQAVEAAEAEYGGGGEAPIDQPFMFSLMADDTGVVDLVFKKDVNKLFNTLIISLDFINTTFDQPYATTGDFIRFLATVADQAKERADAREQEAVGQQAAE